MARWLRVARSPESGAATERRRFIIWAWDPTPVVLPGHRTDLRTLRSVQRVTLAANVLLEQRGGILLRATAWFAKLNSLSPTPLVWFDDTSWDTGRFIGIPSWGLN